MQQYCTIMQTLPCTLLIQVFNCEVPGFPENHDSVDHHTVSDSYTIHGARRVNTSTPITDSFTGSLETPQHCNP